MKRYIVKFVEIRHYEMTVDATDEAGAIEYAKNGPENPYWVSVALEDFRAESITG